MEFGTVCKSRYEAALDRAVATTLFFGAFRPSEVLAWSVNDAGRALRYEDYCPKAGTITLWLRHSKTDQRGRGHWITLKLSPSESLYPVMMLLRYRAGGLLGPGLFFHHADGSPLESQFRAMFNRALEAIGRDPG